MPRPKDAKVWNEDLMAALDARYQLSVRQGKRDAIMWQRGRDAVAAVRKDIYQFRTGTIVNLPTVTTGGSFSKRVARCCEEIIRGVTSVYPAGHVPTHGSHNRSYPPGATTSPSRPAPPSVAPSVTTPTTCATETPSLWSTGRSPPSHNSSSEDNPYNNDHYMKNIKIRGGAYAILMAFYFSQTDVMNKAQICREAQRFCDDQMEANWQAGRNFGAWKGIDTLKSHHLVTEQGFRTFVAAHGGFRDRPHAYTLTRDGKLFIRALLARRPEAAQAAQQAVGTTTAAATAVRSANTATWWETPDMLLESPKNHNLNANVQKDRIELEQWLATAQPGESKEFQVGKSRRLRLHRYCDALQRDKPGLCLTHSSDGALRDRTLRIQLVAKPSSLSQSAAGTTRKRPPPSYDDSDDSTNVTTSSMTPQQNAALAAIQRLEQNQLQKAMAESIQSSVTLSPAYYVEEEEHNLDKDLQEALQMSLLQSNMKKTVRRKLNTDEYDDHVTIALRESLLDSRKRSARETREAVKSRLDIVDPDGLHSLQQVSTPRNIHQKEDRHDKGVNSLSKKKAPATKAVFCSPPSRTVHLEEDEAPTDKKLGTKQAPASLLLLDSDTDDEEEALLNTPIFSTSTPVRRRKDKNNATVGTDKKSTAKGLATTSHIDLIYSDDENEETYGHKEDNEIDIIEIPDSQEDPIDSPIIDIPLDENTNNKPEDEVAIVDLSSSTNSTETTSSFGQQYDHTLTILIDNRERNRNATPRTLRMELTRHLGTGSLCAVWPTTFTRAQVEEVALGWGDFGFQETKISSGQVRRLGVSVERKRIHDLVQRSCDGDHLTQLFRMRQHCTLAILLIEYDTRMAGNVTAYGAQNRDGFDPLDTTISCEEDVFRMFGRIIFCCDGIKFIQTKDEQSSLRAIGALGLMAMASPPEVRRGQSCGEIYSSSKNYNATQSLSDQLKKGGIPWRLAKRVASTIGGSRQLEGLYRSCCNEVAKLKLLSHLLLQQDCSQGGLCSSPDGWSDAIYRIVVGSKLNAKDGITGEGALLSHKDMVHDHGSYLSILHQEGCPDRALECCLMTHSRTTKAMETTTLARKVVIHLSREQACKYFPPSHDGQPTFYDLVTRSNATESPNDTADYIIMYAVSNSFASKKLMIYEMEGSDLVNLVQDSWDRMETSTGARRGPLSDFFVTLAREATCRVLAKCSCSSQTEHMIGGLSSMKEVLLVCGLQPALDGYAKKPGYHPEMRTVLDMIFANLMLQQQSRNMTVLQALRKKIDDRVNAVRQLALACLHFGFLVDPSRPSHCHLPHMK